MDALIPIVAITTSLGLPTAIVIIAMLVSHRRKMARYNVIEKAIATNASPEVIQQLVATIGAEENKKRTPPKQKNLIQATILLFIGLAFFVLKFIIGGTDVTGMLAAGAILTMLAIAKFIIALFIIKKDTEQS